MLTLPPDGSSPAQARRFVRRLLVGAGLGALVDDALLLVTELVTNAVVHAGTSLEVRVRRDGAAVHVEVRDASPGSTPVVRGDVDSDREGGRGLFLLDALAQEWGTTHTRAGKSVWFRLGAASGDPPAEQESDKRAERVVTPEVGTAPPAAPLATQLGWLLALPDELEPRMAPQHVLGELLHRLADALDVEDAVLLVESEHDPERWEVVASRGASPPDGLGVAELRRRASLLPGPVGAERRTTLLPLRGRSGAFGVLVLDRGELGTTATAVARLAAERMAMVLRDDRSEIAQRRSRGSLSLLAEASDLFAATLDVQLAVTLAAQLVVPRLGRWAAVYTTAQAAAERGVRLSAVAHEDEDSTGGLRVALSSSAGTAFAERLERELGEQRPTLVAPAELEPVLGRQRDGDVLALPLVARRRLLGGLLVARPVGGRYSAEDVTLLLDLARRAALAVDNARLYEERTAIAHALQASLLPPALPTAPEVDFGARYLPAGEGNEVGGDFYDVVALPDGSFAVAIGDVCGKGAEAAAITGLARNVLSLLVRDGRSPAQALRRLNDAILDLGERGRFCTAALAVVRPSEQNEGGLDLLLCSAGHPPPVVLPVDGAPAFVGRSGTVLGVVEQPELLDERLHLGAGDTLVLYTDGVTERRRGSLMFGETSLLEVLRRAAGSSADGVAGLLEREVQAFAPEVARDDLAVLVVRSTGRPAVATSAPGADVTAGVARSNGDATQLEAPP